MGRWADGPKPRASIYALFGCFMPQRVLAPYHSPTTGRQQKPLPVSHLAYSRCFVKYGVLLSAGGAWDFPERVYMPWSRRSGVGAYTAQPARTAGEHERREIPRTTVYSSTHKKTRRRQRQQREFTQTNHKI